MSTMLKRLGVVVAWLVATFATASLTLAAVTRVGEQVDAGALPVSGADIAARVNSSSTIDVTTTAPTPVTTEPANSTTTTTTIASTSTTRPTTSTSTTGSIVVSVVPEWQYTPGGSVAVTVTGDVVALVVATPAAGFDLDVNETGPDRVEVDFESSTCFYRVRAEAEDGVIEWRVAEGGCGE
jgi:hypothetical protein